MEILLAVSVDFKLDFLCLEREEEQQEEPGYNQHHNHERHHSDAPVSESDFDSEILLQITQGNDIWRGSDWGSDTADIRTDRNCESQADASLAVSRQVLENRSEEGEHHGGGGSVAHEHGEHGNHEQYTQEHGLRILSEWSQKDLGQNHVQTHLGSSDGKHESAHEEHDGRACELSHEILVANQSAEVLTRAQESKLAVGYGEDKEHHGDDGRSPCRHYLKYPHECSKNEKRDSPLLDDCETFYSKPLRRHHKKEDRHQQKQRQKHTVFHAEFCFFHIAKIKFCVAKKRRKITKYV